MNRIKLALLSLLALAFACPIGFRTANADTPTPALEEMKVEDLKALAATRNIDTTDLKKADIIIALRTAADPTTPPTGEETDKQRIARLEMQVERLTTASGVALPQAPAAPTGATALLIQGAGVDAKDVTWRIQAGLTPEQAVMVVQQEKLEREMAANAGGKK